MNYLELYNSLSKITIFSICLVICAGGTVRMTSSGMGCPDWPKCFGLWIPPTDISDLPENYKDIYAESGYDQLDFNVFNTWMEYINRLLGAIAGCLCFILCIVSLLVRNRKIISLSFLLVLLMGFQAWMGALVVYSLLSPFKITIHMLIAVLILSLLFTLYHLTSPRVKIRDNLNMTWIWVALGASIIQIILGTQVRENVDACMVIYDRDSIISQLPIIFEFHRTMAILVLFSNAIILRLYWKCTDLHTELKLILLIICLLLFSGLFMTYYSLIGGFQLIHLISAVSLFAIQFSILLKCSSLSILKIP